MVEASGANIFPLDSLKRVERHQDDRDHQHREGHRARDLLHRLGDNPPLGRAIGPMGQVAPYVLDHHDGRVHDHAHGECEPTQRHEIRRQADWSMTMKVTRKVSGSDTRTTSAVRNSATKRKRTRMTKTPPSRRASTTVRMHASMSEVRS